MPRVQFSDVVPPEKRSIRNIPIPNSARRNKPAPSDPNNSFGPKDTTNSVPIQRKTETLEPVVVEDTTPPIRVATPEINPFGSTRVTPNKTPQYYHQDSFPPTKKRRKWLFGGLALVAVVAFVLVMMTVFASANIIIKPKSTNLTVNMKIKAGPETGEEKRIPYEMIKLSKTKSLVVEATEEEMVERKASGKIIVYNNFSSDPQRLIIRTRFENPDGLVYRIPESIVVPGKTIAGPGSIEVEVFADEPGEKYNVGKTEFTIPGFKNDSARYAAFYAKSATEMSGGLVGKVKKVEESMRQTTLDTLESALRSEMENELALQTPNDLVMLQKSIFYESRELPQEDSGNTATLSVEVTGFALMLRQSALSDVITKKYIATSSEWQGIPVVIEDFSGLTFTDKQSETPSGEVLDLLIQGEALASAKIDTQAVSESLAGVKRDQISATLQNFKGIESVRATIRPAWKRAFPSRSEKISVDTE